ncbi:hypothetical protein THOM_3006 [Trachipleistophora hominis]|uniref:Uncharacterized protein n=1 Tax=Trachipleistophora hominis TaxID=72359 RepID=L7JRJ5_TRAHO|nr:hypothetical protein THOM_3006 [Trachipleistophora hominis]
MHKLVDLIATNDIKGIEAEMGRILSTSDLEGLSELLLDERTKIYFLILAEQLMKQFKLEGRSIAPLVAQLERFSYPHAQLANKFASVYALAGTLDWPLHFPNFLENVLGLMARSDVLGFNIFEKFLGHVRHGNEISEKRRKELKEALNVCAERFSPFLVRANARSEPEIARMCIAVFEHLSTILEFDPQVVLSTYAEFDLESFVVSVLERKQSDAFYAFLFTYLSDRPPNAKMLFALDRKSTPFLEYAIRGLVSDEQCFLAALLYLRRRVGLLYDDDCLSDGDGRVGDSRGDGRVEAGERFGAAGAGRGDGLGNGRGDGLGNGRGDGLGNGRGGSLRGDDQTIAGQTITAQIITGPIDDRTNRNTTNRKTKKMQRICKILENIAQRYDSADNYTRNEIMLFFIDVSRQQFDASFLNVEKVPRELLVQLLKNNEVISDDPFVHAYNLYKQRDKRCFNYIELLCTDTEGEKLMVKALERIALSEAELRSLIENIRSARVYVKIATMIPMYSILDVHWDVNVAEKFFYYLQYDEHAAMQHAAFFYEYFMRTDDFKFCFSILMRMRKALMRMNTRNDEPIDQKIIERCYGCVHTLPVAELKYFIEFVGSVRCYAWLLEPVHVRVLKEWRESEEWAELSALTRIYMGVLGRHELVAPLVELLQIDEISLLRRLLQMLGRLGVPDALRPRCTYLLLVLYNSSALTDLQGDVLAMLVEVYDEHTLRMVSNDQQALEEMRGNVKKRKGLMKAFLRDVKGQQLAEMGRRHLAVGAQGIIKKERADSPDVNINGMF